MPFQSSARFTRLACATFLALASFNASAQAQMMGGPPGGGGGPKEVGVISVEQQAVPVSTTVPGRAIAYEEVGIRPRVSGVISDIVYRAGRPIAVGDVLYRIEDQTYRAQVAAALATVALKEASVTTTTDTVARYEQLIGTGVTAEALAGAKVALLQAEADLSAAKVALEVAQLDLERTEIKSPIAGVADVSTVSVGALVTANQTDALTTVTRSDPIYVDVEESSRRIADIRNQIEAGSVRRGERLDIKLELETGETYEGSGEMVSPGTNVSTTTGTTAMRIKFDNPDRKIMPGQFLWAQIVLGTMDAVLVPQGATSRSAGGELTAFVAVDGRAETRVLTEQGSFDNKWVVTAGITAGEQVIVDGRTNLQNGGAVTPIAVVISPEGIVTPADGRAEVFGEKAPAKATTATPKGAQAREASPTDRAPDTAATKMPLQTPDTSGAETADEPAAVKAPSEAKEG